MKELLSSVGSGGGGPVTGGAAPAAAAAGGAAPEAAKAAEKEPEKEEESDEDMVHSKLFILLDVSADLYTTGLWFIRLNTPHLPFSLYRISYSIQNVFSGMLSDEVYT